MEDADLTTEGALGRLYLVSDVSYNELLIYTMIQLPYCNTL